MFKPVIKWSGSKRSQSAKIKNIYPTNSIGTMNLSLVAVQCYMQ